MAVSVTVANCLAYPSLPTHLPPTLTFQRSGIRLPNVYNRSTQTWLRRKNTYRLIFKMCLLPGFRQSIAALVKAITIVYLGTLTGSGFQRALLKQYGQEPHYLQQALHSTRREPPL